MHPPNICYVSINGQQFGPYTPEQLAQLVAERRFLASDLAWKGGIAEWVPLSHLMALEAVSSQVPTEPTTFMGPSDVAVGIIENVVYRPNCQQIALGDMFLEPSKATYIAYGFGQSLAPIAYGAAAALGGVLAAASIINIKPEELMPFGKENRLIYWGWTPDERAAVKGKLSVIIRRDDIKSFEISGGIAIRTADKTHVFGYAYQKDAVQSGALFEAWRSGELKSYPSNGKFGLHRSFKLTPQRLIKAFLSNASIEPGLVETVVGDDEYRKSLWEGVEQVEPQRRRRLLIAWRAESDVFRERVIHFLREKGNTGGRIPLSVLIWGVAGFLALALNVSVPMSENAHAFFGFMSLLPIGGFVGTLADWHRGPRWYYRQLVDFEKGNPRA